MPTLLFFGTEGPLARAVLTRLLAESEALAGVVLPGRSAGLWRLPPPPPLPAALPMAPPTLPSLAATAWGAGLPLWQSGGWDERALATLREMALDAIIVACWPRRLPDTLLALPRWGGLNVHPSLLPAYRGPAPLFWQRRDGRRSGGVTVHRMAAELDAGPLLAQAALPFPDGATGAALDEAAGQQGGSLLVAALRALAAGHDPAQPQPMGGSYQPWPSADDFVVPSRWSARRAWNFMRATEEWGWPYTLQLADDSTLCARSALDFDPHHKQPRPLIAEGGVATVQFSPGTLRVRLTAHLESV